MSVLVVSRVFPPQVGGSGRFLWEIYRRQPRRSTTIVAGRHSESAAFDRRAPLAIQRLPLDVRNWGLLPWGFLSYVANFRRLLRVVRGKQAAAVHAATLLPEGFLAWMIHKWTGLPYLCFVHGEEIPVAAGSRELAWMARQVLHAAQRVIANSENTRMMLLRDFPIDPEKIAVVTPGVDIDQFCPAASDALVRQNLGWTHRSVILTAGRLQERKGHDCLIQALPSIRKSVPNVLYAIVGAGDRRQALETLAESLGVSDYVRFHGEMADPQLIECYQQCDVFALPNRTAGEDFEGFGMVLVEAQACGRPVLAGTSGGTAETLRDGDTGRLVACDHPAPLADALVEMLSDRDKLDRMGALGRQRAVERFDWNVLAEKARRVFSEVGEVSGIAFVDRESPTTSVSQGAPTGVGAKG